MWGCGVQLSALAAAARADRRYLPRLTRYVAGLKVYWISHDGVGGFNALPSPSPPDRYYDDNAWMVLALLDGYEATRDADLLRLARETHRFVLSGEDARVGGGIYWRENERKSKNTCVNAPAIVSGLRLYEFTKRPEYLDHARRLYEWTNALLQDSDGLYWDNVDLDGRVEKTKWSYNSGLMIRANTLLHRVTRRSISLDEAERIARAAEARWLDAATGGLRDGGRFAHLLCDGFLALHTEDRDPRWRRLVERAVHFVHDEVRDPNGHYANRWDQRCDEAMTKFNLIDQASAARAFWSLARTASE